MDTIPVTTDQMWVVTGITAAIDFGLVALLWRRVRPPWPERMGLRLTSAGALFFALLYGWAAWTYWSTCYGHVLPEWVKWAAPAWGLLEGALGGVFWWVARRVTPGRPVPVFLALGALESVPGHLHGVYRRGLLDACAPVLGISPSSALVFGVFEFGFYWAILLALSYRKDRRNRPRQR